MYKENQNGELYHHGVKGMKWGVRKEQPTRYMNSTRKQLTKINKRITAVGKSVNKKVSTALKAREVERQKRKAAEEEAQRQEQQKKRINALRKKKLKDMTTDEIKELKERLELEKSYVDLKKQTSGTDKSRVRKLAEDVLESSSKNTLTQLATYLEGTSINWVFKDVFHDSAIINPKKGQKDK